jgi:chromosome segregation ATPase
MSTSPQSDDDLDRTDELPRLDISVYESQLAADGDDTLASTDAWAVESLRDLEDTPPQDTAAVRFPRPHAPPDDLPSRPDVTLDATRILGRIQNLEAELDQAKQREEDLHARIGRLTDELAVREKETRGLSADNARLTEQRSVHIERIRALEQQLKEEAAQYEQEIAQQRALRAAEQDAATTARLALEQQIAELASTAARLRETSVRLDEEAQSATQLARTQSEVIEQFKQRLASEEKNAAQLARLLAAKIAEHAAANQEIARRDDTIVTLAQTHDELAALLDTARRTIAQLEEQARDACSRNTAMDLTLRERDDAIAAQEKRIATLESELRDDQDAIALLTDERNRLQQTLTAERDAQRRAQQALHERTQEIEQLHCSSETLQAQLAALQQQLVVEQSARTEQADKLEKLERELEESRLRRELLTTEADSLRAQIRQYEAELQQALEARDLMSSKAGELQQLQEELAEARRELYELRANLTAKHSELAERDQALREYRDALAELREHCTSVEQQLETARTLIEQLEERDREHESKVLADAADLAAARRQLAQQLAAVQSMEQAIRARDTLADRLRAELQTAQDERAIIAGQLAKSRARNKSMARQIFARDNQIAALKADLAVHVEALAAIREDVNRATAAAAEAEQPDRVLEPVDHDGDIIVLNKKMMTIGRTSDNDICIPSKLVSRIHARLLIGPNAVILEDAGSTNGCLVNNIQVKQHVIRDGDILSIGDLKFRLRTRTESATQARDNVVPFAQ